jgi:peptide/nickel transport system substrate-binding protein
MQRPGKQRTLALAMVAIGAALFVASVSASPKTPPPPDTFRIGTTGASVQTDPALAYITIAWQIEYATCAKLVNYPDAEGSEEARLVPEIAAGMPTVSADGLTYTFQIRNDFAFSPPASGVVTAQSMKYTFERTLHPDLASPGAAFLMNIEGARAYHEGGPNEITGIVAQGSTLTIHLLERQGEFLTLLAMPFLCAVPTTLPPVEQFAPIPSAGPYYISGHVIDQQITITRNPNYDGPRPRRFNTFEYLFNLNEEAAFQQVLSGDLDAGPLPAAHVQWVADAYGPKSEAAGRGLQQFFPNPSTCVGYLPLNTARPTFAPGQENMRKAVNYAVDRVLYTDPVGPYAASPYDQYLPPGMPGYEDIDVYPDRADLEHARNLAGWHPGDPLRPITVYYRSSGTINPAQYQVVKTALEQIGFDVTGVGFSGGDIYVAMGVRGAPFDLGVSVGWCEDYHDPWSFMQLFDGTLIQDENNVNFSYFDDPVFNERLHAAKELVGDERYDTFRDIEHDLVRDAAPWAALRTYNNRDIFSRRIGCHLYNAPQFGGVNFANLCVRPEISIGDTIVMEPDSGTTVVHVPVSLSSEMDNTVTVDFATEDGTAHEGEDYVATSGTVTFPPHQRSATVDVVVNSDSVTEPDETFA